MAAEWNQWQGIGNLCADPELRYTPKQTPVCSMRVACNTSYLDAQQERQTSVTFVDVRVWGARGKACAEHLRKGSPVFVVGRLDQDTWDQDGQSRTKHYITADKVEFLNRRESGNGQNE